MTPMFSPLEQNSIPIYHLFIRCVHLDVPKTQTKIEIPPSSPLFPPVFMWSCVLPFHKRQSHIHTYLSWKSGSHSCFLILSHTASIKYTSMLSNITPKHISNLFFILCPFCTTSLLLKPRARVCQRIISMLAFLQSLLHITIKVASDTNAWFSLTPCRLH